ncbi:Tropomodulin-2, partial [Nowakowskiella sp. JEL0078]
MDFVKDSKQYLSVTNDEFADNIIFNEVPIHSNGYTTTTFESNGTNDTNVFHIPEVASFIVAPIAEDTYSLAGSPLMPRTRQKSIANSISEYTWEEETISVEKKLFETTSSEAASEELDEIKDDSFESLGPTTGIFSSSVSTIMEEGVVTSEDSDTALTPVQEIVVQSVNVTSIDINKFLDTSSITITEPIVSKKSSMETTLMTYIELVDFDANAEDSEPSIGSQESSETAFESSSDTTTTTTTTNHTDVIDKDEPTAAAVDIQACEFESTQSLTANESIELVHVNQETTVKRFQVEDTVAEPVIESIYDQEEIVKATFESKQNHNFEIFQESVIKAEVKNIESVIDTTFKSFVETTFESGQDLLIKKIVESTKETLVELTVEKPPIESRVTFDTSSYDNTAITKVPLKPIDFTVSVVKINDETKVQELLVLEKVTVLEDEAEELSKKNPGNNESEELAKKEAEELVKKVVEELAKDEAEELAKKEAEELAKKETEELAKMEAEVLAKMEAEELTKKEAAELAKKKSEELAKKEAEELIKKEAEGLAKKESEELTKNEEELIKMRANELFVKEAEERVQKEADELAKKCFLKSVKEEFETITVNKTIEVFKTITNEETTFSQKEEIIEEEFVSQPDLLSISINSYTETPSRTERGRSISSYAYERSSSTSSNYSRFCRPSVIPPSPMLRTSAGGAPLPLSAIAAPVRHVNPLLDEILYSLELLQSDDDSLEYLDLKDCAIFTVNHGSALAVALAKNTHLRSLVLTNTKLQTSTAIEIAEALKCNKFLQYLVLDDNLIGPAGIKALAESLRSNDTLLELRVAHQ